MLDNTLNTLLIVDDAVENLTVLDALLRPYYQIRVATSGEKALRIAASAPRPDLILMDVMMPGMDGYQVFDYLRADPATRDIPVIFVTAMDSAEAELRGLDAGAVDYIIKPLVPAIVLARVRTQLELKQAHDWLSNKNVLLEAEVARRMLENARRRVVTPVDRSNGGGRAADWRWAQGLCPAQSRPVRQKLAHFVLGRLPQQITHRRQRAGVVERRHLPSELHGCRPVCRQQELPAGLE